MTRRESSRERSYKKLKYFVYANQCSHTESKMHLLWGEAKAWKLEHELISTDSNLRKNPLLIDGPKGNTHKMTCDRQGAALAVPHLHQYSPSGNPCGQHSLHSSSVWDPPKPLSTGARASLNLCIKSGLLWITQHCLNVCANGICQNCLKHCVGFPCECSPIKRYHLSILF